MCKVRLLSHHGKYVVGDSYGNANANGKKNDPLSIWTVNFIESSQISLKSANQKYLVAEENGMANANRDFEDSWERFTVKSTYSCQNMKVFICPFFKLSLRPFEVIEVK